jgi:hypothetical protein
VETGSGVDSIVFDNSAKIDRDAKFKLGAGADQFTFDGRVGRTLSVDGGDGTDTFTDLGGMAKTVRLNSVEVQV